VGAGRSGGWEEYQCRMVLCCSHKIAIVLIYYYFLWKFYQSLVVVLGAFNGVDE
jgi:hypothetical protein